MIADQLHSLKKYLFNTFKGIFTAFFEDTYFRKRKVVLSKFNEEFVYFFSV